jgi:hypothetical protein
MKIYPPSSNDDDHSSPDSADVREFARRRHEEREDAVRRPHLDDDAWRWFLSLFADRGNNPAEPGDRPNRRVA